MTTEAEEKTRAFIEYCYSYYGPEGVWPLGCSREHVEEAVSKYLKGQFDSVGREFVAGILLDMGFAYPDDNERN